MKKQIAMWIIVLLVLISVAPASAQSADWSRSCQNLGGNDVCNDFLKCEGTSIWDSADYAGENCCIGKCVELTREEAVAQLTPKYGKEEAEFRVGLYYEENAAEATAVQEGGNATSGNVVSSITAAPQFESSGQANPIIIIVALLIAVFIALIIFLIMKKRRMAAKATIFLIAALFFAGLASAQDFSFTAISDTHSTPISNIDSILSTNPDFIVHLGDFTINSFAFDEYSVLSSVPILPVQGNHDEIDAKGEYEKFWAGKKPSSIQFTDDSHWPDYYSFDYNGYHFITLDYTGVTLSKSLSKWLEADLSKYNSEPTIIFSHIPAVNIYCGLHPTDRIRGLLGIIKKNTQVKAVFSGHQHCYVQQQIAPGVVQVVVGTAAADIRYPTGDNQYKKQLEDKHLFVTASVSDGNIDVCAKVVETGETYKCSTLQAPQQQKLTSIPLRQKIEQMIMATPGNDGALVSKYHLGGVILMQDGEGTGTVPHSQGTGGTTSADVISSRVADYQSRSTIPLLVSSDIEGGKVNRIAHIYDPGSPATMGTSSQIAEKMSKTSELMRNMGINMDLAPVVDVASNPNALMVTMERSFGGSAAIVEQKAKSYIQGLHQNSVAATIKHFPGYGDEAENSDSKKITVSTPISRLDGDRDVFNSLKTDTDAIMMSNIIYSNYDANNQAVVSPKIVQLARENFDGVIISDDLTAVSVWDSPQYKNNHKQLAVDAVKAGIDILLIVNYKKSNAETDANINELIDGIEEAVKNGVIPESRIDESVARIEALKKKYVTGYQQGLTVPSAGGIQNCLPGSVFGGAPLAVQPQAESMVEVTEIEGETICSANCKLKQSASQAVYSLNKMFRDNGCKLKINSVSASGDSITIDTSLCSPYEKRIKLACQAGWVNDHGNGAVFEYGTDDWRSAMSSGLCQWPSEAAADDINGEFKKGHASINFDALDKKPDFNTQQSGAPETFPKEALTFKQVSAFGKTTIIKVDPRYFDIKTLSAAAVIGSSGGSCSYCTISLADAVKKYPNFVAGVNAAYFGTTGRDEGIKTAEQKALYKKYAKPAGWFVEDGKWVQGARAFDASGYYIVENGVPKIIPQPEFNSRINDASITSAVTGANKATAGRPRTQICITNNGNVKLVASGPTPTVKDLSDYLKANEDCASVLNLDGGGSTMYYYNWAGQSELYKGTDTKRYSGGRPVANFIVVVPKTATSYAQTPLSQCPSQSVINYAGTSAQDEVLYASYIISGAFSTVLDYSLQPFLDAQDRMKELITSEDEATACGKSTTVECLAEKTKGDREFSYYFKKGDQFYHESDSPSAEARAGWEKYCENPDETFFNDFAEFYDSCLSSGEECYCQMPAAYSLSSDARLLFDKISDSRYTISLVGDETVHPILTKNHDAEFPSEISYDGKFELLYPSPGQQVAPTKKSFSQIVLNKVAGRLLFSESPLTATQCAAEESQMIKVCAVSKDSSLLIKANNPLSGNLEEVPLTLRFAFTPPNTPPPDVRDVKAQDLLRAKDAVVISWQASTARNVNQYKIYSSSSDFKGQKSEDASKVISSIVVDTSGQEETNSITLNPSCAPAGVKQCSFEFDAQVEVSDGVIVTEKKQLKPGSLVYASDEQRYYYVVSLADATPSFFGVTAVNKKGLESVNIISTALGESFDDVPPGHVIFVLEAGPPPVIKWQAPSVNINGEPLDLSKATINYDGIASCPDGEKVFPYGTATQVNQVDLGSCELRGIIAKKLIPLPLQPMFTPDRLSPSDPSDQDIINYLLQ